MELTHNRACLSNYLILSQVQDRSYTVYIKSVIHNYFILPSLQVHLQTQQHVSKGLVSMGIGVIKNEGVIGLYNGISASILRQVGVI